MSHNNGVLGGLLQGLDLGSSIAESDDMLEVARVETSAFADLLFDRADLVPGTKGSGKSALFRIFAHYLPDHLLSQRKVVVAHGVQAAGNPIFGAFASQFETLSEDEFVSFWCIYLVSLAHEHFIRGERYQDHLRPAAREVRDFKNACTSAGIPEIPTAKSLLGVLEWSLQALRLWRPRLRYAPPGEVGEFELDLFGGTAEPRPAVKSNAETELPRYVGRIKEALDRVLAKADLSLWLMVDRLDEIFPRRSNVERIALRGLLKAMRHFASGSVRVKVFLRDDMLDQVVRTPDGFVALTHLTARQADTLRWTPEQLLTMLVKRIFANSRIVTYLGVNPARIEASAEYQTNCFYEVFPPTVHRGDNQSNTLRWICNRCADGRGVVTPRDVLELVIRAKQRQQDLCIGNPDGTTDCMISSAALQYGLQELSIHKRRTYLEAEFPHLWPRIEKFADGKADYDVYALQAIFGKEWRSVTDDLVAIGFLAKSGQSIYSIPRLYRHGLNVTQGKA